LFLKTLSSLPKDVGCFTTLLRLHKASNCFGVRNEGHSVVDIATSAGVVLGAGASGFSEGLRIHSGMGAFPQGGRKFELELQSETVLSS